MKRFITTPIYYVNDVPHIGHAYTTIIADTLAKFYRLCGDDVLLLTGTDEHGQKIEQAAQKYNFTPNEYTDKISAKFKNIWDEFKIDYDIFMRTTYGFHIDCVQKAFLKMYENQDIYKGEYEGNYCISCETFFPENQLVSDDCCPDCGKKTIILKEESYFFRLSKYQDKLLKWYEENDNCIFPKSKKNEVVAFVKGGLKDLSITRTGFNWGIKLPNSINEPKHIMYVWLDALLNYISALGYLGDNKYMDFWNNSMHIVGKDILRFHAVYWPAFLMSLGLPLPKTVAAHGWWTRDGKKMSKSLGNVIDPLEVANAYGFEEFRYFLLREVPFGQDGDFSQRALINRINGELCNEFGNLLNRIIGMSEKYSNFEIDENCDEFEELNLANECIKSAIENIKNLSINRYLEELWKILNIANGAITRYEPWNLIKNNQRQKAMGLMSLVANLLAKVAVLLSPVMPEKTRLVADALGFKIDNKSYNDLILNLDCYSFKAKKTQPLFTKIEAELLPQAADVPNNTSKQESVKNIDIDEFKKINIKVGTVLSCENVESSDKLLKFSIDVGEDCPRQIISGIAKFYNPKDLIGRQVCVIVNLKPAKIFKHLSQGMILSADDGSLTLLSVDKNVKNGAIVG